MNNVMKAITSGILLAILSGCQSEHSAPNGQVNQGGGQPLNSGDTTTPTNADGGATPIDSSDNTAPTSPGDSTPPIDTGDSTPPVDTGDQPNEVEVVTLLFLEKSEANTASADICHPMSQILEDASDELIYGLEDGDLSRLRFTTDLLERADHRYSNLDGSIVVTPNLWFHYQLRSLDVPKDIWDAQGLASLDVTQAVLESECFAVKQMTVQTDEYTLTPVTSLRNWASDEAIENQAEYDAETLDIFKSLYGRDGLGYGDYAKAGLHLRHNPIPIDSAWDYNQFSLHWAIEYPDIELLSDQLLPAAITKQYKPWQQECSPIEIQFAKDVQFVESAPVIANFPVNCHEQPLFTTEQPSELNDPTAPEFLQYLTNAQRLHLVTQQKNNLGQFIRCNRQDEISMDGCSQPIVRTTGELIKGYIMGEHDLYVRVSFSDFASRSYYLNRLNGVMMVLGN